MAKTKLLSILKIFIITATLDSYAFSETAPELFDETQVREMMEQLDAHKPTQADIEFADDVSRKGLDMTLDYINELLGKNKVYGEDYVVTPEKARRDGLFVFVSHSMPVSTLREYASEAVKYNAALVFKGLPFEGSGAWGEFAKLVQSLNVGDVGVAIQIDEEPFDEFEIKSVPTIILREEKFCMQNMSCKPAFDKISGNIGIRYALEQFARDGEMRARAGELLNAE